jgi:hypothetical protein
VHYYPHQEATLMQRKWWRGLIAVIVGIVSAGLCIALIETLTHRMVAGEPVFAAAVGALFVGALVGGSVAVRLAGDALYGWVVAAALALLSVINVLSFTHPGWFVPVAAVALAIGGWLATRTAPGVKAAP